MDGVTIAFRGVRFAYRPGAIVLDLPALEIGPGLTLLRGANGAGKSTLMRLAAGIEAPDEGAIAIGGRDLWTDEVEARRLLAYISEYPDLTPYATVKEILLLVAGLRGEPRSAAQEALASTGLTALAGRTVRELSLGQRRRAVLAAAMIGVPAVLLLDEPLEALDAEMRERCLAWIGAALARGGTVLAATHDPDPFLRLAVDRAPLTIRLQNGRAVPGGS